MKLVITAKGAFIRNLATALVNGTITLILLLIAPLGLAAVIVNTMLVTFSTFMVNSLGDRVVQWLLAAGNDPQRFVANAQSPVKDLPRISSDFPSQLGDRQDGDQSNL
jgi:hypothetical protein